MKRSQHVVPTISGGWAVRKAGAARASKLFENQQEAVTYAEHLAEQARSAMYIHRSDGTVQGRRDFGAGQFLSKA